MTKYNIKNFLLVSSLIAATNFCMPANCATADVQQNSQNVLNNIQFKKNVGNIIEIKLLTKKRMASRPLVFDRGKNIYLVSMPDMNYTGERKLNIKQFEKYLTDVTVDFVPYTNVKKGGYTRIIIKTNDNVRIKITNNKDLSVRLNPSSVSKDDLLKIMSLLGLCGGVLLIAGGAFYIYVRNKNKKILNDILDNTENILVEDIPENQTEINEEQNDVLEFLDDNPNVDIAEIENIDVVSVDDTDNQTDTEENIPSEELIETIDNVEENDAFTPSADEIVNDILNNDMAVEAISETVLEQINSSENNNVEDNEITEEENTEPEIISEEDINNLLSENNAVEDNEITEEENTEPEIISEEDINNLLSENNAVEDNEITEEENTEPEIISEEDINNLLSENNAVEDNEIIEDTEYTQQQIENTSAGSTFIPAFANLDFTNNNVAEEKQQDAKPEDTSNTLESEFDIAGFDGILGEIPDDNEINTFLNSEELATKISESVEENNPEQQQEEVKEQLVEENNPEQQHEEVEEQLVEENNPEQQQEEVEEQLVEENNLEQQQEEVEEQLVEENNPEQQQKEVEEQLVEENNPEQQQEEVEEQLVEEIKPEQQQEEVKEQFVEEAEHEQQTEIVEQIDFFNNSKDEVEFEQAPGTFFKDTFDYSSEIEENGSYFKEENTVDDMDDSEPVVISQKDLAEDKILYLIKHEGKFSLIGIQNNSIYVLNKFETIPEKTKILVKLNEENENNLIYIVKVDKWRALISVSDDKMENLLTLS